MAALHSAGAERLLGGRFVAFHVSGGTTEILSVQPLPVGFDAEIVGGTEDLHAGQAIDRAGVMMGLPFPCGKEMERLASENTKALPPVRVSVKGTHCHFSGLENLSAKLWKETGDRALVSAFVMEYTARTLLRLTEGLDALGAGLPIVYAGGVMSNRYLQSRLSARPDTFFAAPEFSADNAAGIALLCRRAYRKENLDD